MKFLKVITVVLAATFALAAQTAVCPQYQHYNGAVACEFDSYLDGPTFLASQNKAIAESLNADPGTVAWTFARQYATLPQNQQSAIFACEILVFTSKYFVGSTVPSYCVTNGVLDPAKIIAANPAPGNPANLPSVVWNDAKGKFDPAVPPQAAQPVTASAVVASAGERLVGDPAYGNVFYSTKAGLAVPDGQHVFQDGVEYVKRQVVGLMGRGDTFEKVR